MTGAVGAGVKGAVPACLRGAKGASGYAWPYTQLLVVPLALPSSGVRRALMLQAESVALARGCHHA